ncbi:uncharacterized protein TRIADDRAFT_62229 [Trichoplax adhaerens]|uniref:Uncharacterized protein n=1 Tax=Trichoplax adhaerens TaxID=10228 RepID=B3SD71_TRIAD|nr:predicted protein [Trichoplax adhaerens]EDV19347.1 predicted protein [Trichoplax adhaerens]|eukprot:XP_002118198.1 predicted protein [Trichoplax adhaerens]
MKITLLVFTLCMATIMIDAYPSRHAMIEKRKDNAISEIDDQVDDEYVLLKLPKSWAKEYLGELLNHYLERQEAEVSSFRDDKLPKEFVARSNLKAFGVNRNSFNFTMKLI